MYRLLAVRPMVRHRIPGRSQTGRATQVIASRAKQVVAFHSAVPAYNCPCMKKQSLEEFGRCSRWLLAPGFTVYQHVTNNRYTQGIPIDENLLFLQFAQDFTEIFVGFATKSFTAEADLQANIYII